MRIRAFSWIALIGMLAIVPVRATTMTLWQSGSTWTVMAFRTAPGDVVSAFHIDLNFDPLAASFQSGSYGSYLGPLVSGSADDPFVFGTQLSVVHFQQRSVLPQDTLESLQPMMFPLLTATFSSPSAKVSIAYSTLEYNWVPEPRLGWLAGPIVLLATYIRSRASKR